jgi:nitrogen fixation protein NifU and related proteins
MILGMILGMDAQKFYQELVLRWNADQRFVGAAENATHQSVGANPLCGDSLCLSFVVQAGRIHCPRFNGEMSAITTASAAILCHLVEHKTPAQAEALATAAMALLYDEKVPAENPELGDFAGFRVVRRYPNRIKTASLPWATLRAALAGKALASTET